jgi:hypothetical protein
MKGKEDSFWLVVVWYVPLVPPSSSLTSTKQLSRFFFFMCTLWTRPAPRTREGLFLSYSFCCVSVSLSLCHSVCVFFSLSLSQFHLWGLVNYVLFFSIYLGDRAQFHNTHTLIYVNGMRGIHARLELGTNGSTTYSYRNLFSKFDITRAHVLCMA